LGATPAEGDLLLGRYTLGPLVGLGGTAKVFRAWDQECGGTVAVKVFPPGSASPTRDGRREREVLTGVRHAGLIEIRDSGVDDEGFPFVVMDFIEGESLAARLRRGPVPPTVVAELGTTLAAALAHVHERGIVHRDIKPGNVLLDSDGRPWLADFGIARIVDATRVTATGVVVGTAAYMAPEQVRGEAVGPAADVYALGLVLLEAVTGRREYDGGALESALARLNRSPRVPSDVPDPLAATIRGMTLGEPAERPSAEQVAAALAEPPPDRLDPPPRHVGRRLVPVGALALLVTTALGGALLLGAGSTGGARSQAGGGAGPDFGSAPSGVPAAPPAAAPPAPVAPPPVVIAPVAAAARVAAAVPAGVAPASAARAVVAAPRRAAAPSDAGSPRRAATTQSATTQSAAGQTASTAADTRAQDDQGDQPVAKGENENKGKGNNNGKHNGEDNGNGNKGNGNNGNGNDQGED
jgi:eukaryotic-like serine/threonine-protein kinase